MNVVGEKVCFLIWDSVDKIWLMSGRTAKISSTISPFKYSENSLSASLIIGEVMLVLPFCSAIFAHCDI